MPDPKVLLVEDDPAVRHGMAAFLRANSLDVDETDTCQKALERFKAVGHDVVIADYSLPDGTSLDLLPQFKKLSEETPFIILTAHGSIDLAVRAIKEGAEQFLRRPRRGSIPGRSTRSSETVRRSAAWTSERASCSSGTAPS